MQHDVPVSGANRAKALIDQFDNASVFHEALSFARIIVDLFPDWFDFGPAHFAVMKWDRGLKLVLSGLEWGVAWIPTSNSRCMSCFYVGSSIEQARMDMHYSPSPDEEERARAVIHCVLHRLFPDRCELSEDLAKQIPEGSVFPPQWDGQIRTSATSDDSPLETKKRSSWKFWSLGKQKNRCHKE